MTSLTSQWFTVPSGRLCVRRCVAPKAVCRNSISFTASATCWAGAASVTRRRHEAWQILQVTMIDARQAGLNPGRAAVGGADRTRRYGVTVK